MSGSFDLSEWELRRSALMNELDRMKAVYEMESANASGVTPEASAHVWQTLGKLVQGLHEFALGNGDPNIDDGSLFSHYAQGFRNDTSTPPPDYPPEYIMRTLIDQVAYDITIFQFIAGQRWQAQHDPALAEGLDRADKLARLALEPMCGNFLEPETTALVYLTRVPRARVIPYATVALISLPHTLTATDGDLLAVAHEAGHHLFWNSQYNLGYKRSGQPLAKTPVWRWKWREEIFADVYAAWVAGPCVGLSIQEYLADNLPEKFCFNDEEHPISAIRPTIYQRVLQRYFPDWATYLENRWVQHVATRPACSSFLSGTAPVDMGVGSTGMLAFVDAYLDILNSQAAQPVTGWHKNLGTPALTGQDDHLKIDFRNFLDDASLPVSPVALTRPVPLKYKPVTNDSLEVWKEAISIGGWVSRGPEQSPDPFPP